MPSSPSAQLPRSVLFLFLDGIGLGAQEADVNPFAAFTLPTFERLAGGPWLADTVASTGKSGPLQALDATLGVDGLPQSGTGQATLFTGVNCARIAGRHFGPYPHSSSRPVIAERNLFVRLQERRGPDRGAFANAYPDRFFAYVNRTQRWTVTTRCCVDAGVRLRTFDDWLDGKALTADLTAEGWQKIGYSLTPLSEPEAGRRLAELSKTYDLTLFEYFHTDKVGHGLSLERAGFVLRSLDAFLDGLTNAFDFDSQLLVLTSDHGNLEDLSTKSHTRNPVPFLALGAGADRLDGLSTIEQVTPAVLALLAPEPTGP